MKCHLTITLHAHSSVTETLNNCDYAKQARGRTMEAGGEQLKANWSEIT